MQYDIYILSAIFIPTLGSLVLPLAGRLSLSLRNYFALGLVICSLVCSLKLIGPVLAGEALSTSTQVLPNFTFSFVADGLAVFMACVSTLISAIIILFSIDYISHYKNQNEYYFLALLFLGAMMGLIFSANLILLYIFWEITAITSWRLIGFFREDLHLLRADKAFLTTVFGALLMLVGFISIFQQTGSFDMGQIAASAKINPISNIAIGLILAGILSKSATLPFHTWLPDAGIAPAPVTAFLHAAVLVKIGVYVFARLFIATFSLPEIWHTVVPIIAAISMLVSACAALLETDLKRIIAYSTVSQIGFIFFGLSTGNAIGIIGSLLYILMHGLAKAGLFLCAGIIEQNTKTKDITKLGGLIKTMPLTAVAFLLCSFSVMGVPPMGGFFSKYMVFSAAFSANQFLMAFIFLAGAFLTIIYLFRIFNMVFLGEAKIPAKEKSWLMIACVLLLAFLSLCGGIFVHYPARLAQFSAGQMLEASE